MMGNLGGAPTVAPSPKAIIPAAETPAATQVFTKIKL